jgi:hypothetical protein
VRPQNIHDEMLPLDRIHECADENKNWEKRMRKGGEREAGDEEKQHI